MNSKPSGRDAVAINVDPEGELRVEWNDGVETITDSPDLRTRIRAHSYAAQRFLERKGRPSWQRRI